MEPISVRAFLEGARGSVPLHIYPETSEDLRLLERAIRESSTTLERLERSDARLMIIPEKIDPDSPMDVVVALARPLWMGYEL